MIDFSPESNIENIEVLKPDVPGDLVAALAPDILLLIESGLIGRQVFQMNLSMALEEKPYFVSFVPFSPVHIEVDNVTAELFQHMLQYLHESLAVTLGGAYQAFPPQQGGHPTGEIEPLAMLAGGRDLEALTFLSPASSQAGMKAKAGLILKDDGFIGFELGQFFLTLGGNPLRPWPWPEDKHSQPVSSCSPDDATSIGPVVSSTSRQGPLSGGLPASARPMCLSAYRTHGEAFPGLAVSALSMRVSTDPDGLAGALAPKPELRSRLPHVSIVPESSGLNPTKRLHVPDAGPPKPAVGQRSSILPTPPVPASQVPADFSWLPWDASPLKLSRREYSISMKQLLVRLY